MRGYNCSFIIEKGLFIEYAAATGTTNYFNAFRIPAKYIVCTQFMAASVLLKNTVSIVEWIDAATFVK